MQEALWIGIVLAETIAEVHNLGIRHLDIKPRNVLFSSRRSGEWPVPKIGDWGLARLQLDHEGSMDALSTAYAAPEQFDSEQFGDVDHRTDVYQLACILYETLTGSPPFEGSQYSGLQEILGPTTPTPPSERRPELPEAIDDPLLTALSREKNDRYDHMLYFKDKLHNVFRMWQGKDEPPAESSKDHHNDSTRSSNEEVMTEFYCPECGMTRPTDGNMRGGDICPECKRGYVGTRSV